ncbi:MAG: glycosyltransferase family 2 protein [Solirubrobacteraceae bacterium]
MKASVTVAIPTLNAGSALAHTLAAVRSQELDRAVQLLVCDSGSADETVATAKRYGATVIEIPGHSFSHGQTRNLLISRSEGDHVAFLTQDAVPAHHHWLQGLLGAFTLAPSVGLTFGPYRPRADACPSVARELTQWFDSFSPGGGPRIDVVEPEERGAPARDFLGHLGFFSDVNGCVSRAAWEQVPFRDVPYAEDHRLAQDMLRAGFAKVYVPAAAVIHSHSYTHGQWLRRSFDEARAMRAVYGWEPPLSPRAALMTVAAAVAADRRWWRAATEDPAGLARRRGPEPARLGSSLLHHSARLIGARLGYKADSLPAGVCRRLSLERRGR